MSALLEVEGLSVDLPVARGTLKAVRGLSLAVHAGEVVCLVGESGCGKSMTALALMNLLPRGALRQARRLVFAGHDLLTLPEREMSDLRGSELAMIFQEPMTSLNPCYTVGNQLEEAMRRHAAVSRAQARERARLLLEKVGVTSAPSRLMQYPHQLSGGLRQRVMIAMALMCNPRLLIGDEPTTALDVTTQAQILRLLAALRREFGLALLLITHDLGIVARIADRVAVMYAGQIVETGTVDEVFRRPLHPYTQGLLRCVPAPAAAAAAAAGGPLQGRRLGSIPGMVPSLVNPAAECSFRERCPYAFADCAQGDVPLAELAPGRAFRCRLTPEQALRHVSDGGASAAAVGAA